MRVKRFEQEHCIRPGVARPVLVVEDDSDSLLMMSTCLSVLGQPVLTACNGHEALRLARAHHPCVILLDFMMPVMSGEEFRAVQLSDDSISEIPVLLVTAHPWARALADRLHVDDVIEKPISVDRLLGVVDRYCDHPDSERH